MANTVFSETSSGLSNIMAVRAYSVVTNGTPGVVGTISPPAVAASTLTRGGTGNLTATFTATAAHRLADQQTVTIAGATVHTGFNGTYVITVTSTTVFTYTLAADPGGNASGSPTASYTPYPKRMLLVNDPGNAAAITFSPDLNADVYSLGVGLSFGFTDIIPPGCSIDISYWNIKSASASQKLWVLFS
jgi:uncharacterized protein YdeI (BOF family)